MKICEIPSEETELNSRMPSIVLICSSRTSVTSVSTVSGEAPSRIVVTVTKGNSTSGFRSTLSRLRDTRPSTTSATFSMSAKTGRRIEMSGRFSIESGGAGG